MKEYIKKAVLHGLIGMSFGPLIMAVIYTVLHTTGVVDTLSVPIVVKAIFSVTLMAFIAAGLPVLYQIEQLPLISAILLHALGLYLDYLILYLINDWIVKDFTAIAIFTAIFFAGFGLIWIMIYLTNVSKAKKLNQKLRK